MQKSLLVVVKGYPRVSETFIHRELLAFEEKGVELKILSLVETDVSDDIFDSQLNASISYMPRGWWSIVLKLFFYCSFLTRPRLNRTLLKFSSDGNEKSFKYLCWANWLYTFGKLGQEELIYSHFSHSPAELSFYLSRYFEKKFYISAHAKDVYLNYRDDFYKSILEKATKVFTCHQKCYQLICECVSNCFLLPHGIERIDDQWNPMEWELRESSKNQSFIYFGRLVKKKGIDIVLKSLSHLKEKGVSFRFDIYGDGVERDDLEKMAKELNLQREVFFHGAYKRDDLLKMISKIKFIFLGGFQKTAEGDEDGLPNVLLEAMLMKCPIVTTSAGSIENIVTDGETGYLISGHDEKKYAEELSQILERSDFAYTTEKSYQNIVDNFSFERNFNKLFKHFEDFFPTL